MLKSPKAWLAYVRRLLNYPGAANVIKLFYRPETAKLLDHPFLADKPLVGKGKSAEIRKRKNSFFHFILNMVFSFDNILPKNKRVAKDLDLIF